MTPAQKSLVLLKAYERAVLSGDRAKIAEAAKALDAWDRECGLDRKRWLTQRAPYRHGEKSSYTSLGDARSLVRSRGQLIRHERVRREKALGLSRERLEERFRAAPGKTEEARRDLDNALRFRGWVPSSGLPCPRFEPADGTGPLDDDACCACLRRYDEHAKPRGVPCLEFVYFVEDDFSTPSGQPSRWRADPAALSGEEPCDSCGHSLAEHDEAEKYRADPCHGMAKP